MTTITHNPHIVNKILNKNNNNNNNNKKYKIDLREKNALSLCNTLSLNNKANLEDNFPYYNRDLLKDSLALFYKNSENLNRVVPIITEQTKISLRLLDWFVTNYSKKYKTLYLTKCGDPFIVHMEYKAQLKAYHKEKFDPFCRSTGKHNNQIQFKFYKKDLRSKERSVKSEIMKTTVGQLNFFKWAIQNKVIDYVIDNFKNIESDMEEYNRNRKNRKDEMYTYMTARQSITTYNNVHIVVKFD